jgi:putative transposase
LTSFTGLTENECLDNSFVSRDGFNPSKIFVAKSESNRAECFEAIFGTSPILNPKGIPPSSPRLRRRSYLGKTCTFNHNPNGVVPLRAFVHHRSMPQSHSAVYLHLVFSTKDRRPFLRNKSDRDSLHAYMGAISKQLDCPTILVGGVEDHVHLLARFGRTISQAEWVKELKRVSCVWLKEQSPDYKDFNWQGGYADFSVSQSNLDQVKNYILHRDEHHRELGFQDELRALLRKHETEWDEQYVWD